jgi:glutamine synthetase
MAAQIYAGLDGLKRSTDPGALDEEPYAADRPALPASLMDAVRALEADRFFRRAFGDAFVDYILTVKNSEVNRFLAYVTDWEHREYFEVF